MLPRTAVDAVVSAATHGGTLTVLGIDGPEAASWAEIHLRARRVAAVLATYGVGRGSLVALRVDTSMPAVVAVQGSWLAGAAVTVLPPVLPGRAAPPLPAAFDLVVSDAPGDGLALADLERPVAPASPAASDPADLAVLQYTSGSMSQPRGVPVTHGNLVANTLAIRRAGAHWDHHDRGPQLSWLPLHHDMGLIGYLATPMLCGCSLVLMSPRVFARRPAAWLEAVTRYRPFSTAGPNFAFGLATRLLRGRTDIDLSSLRTLICGGEPVSAATMTAFTAEAARHGLPSGALSPGYGLAESTLAVTMSPLGRGAAFDSVDPDVLDRTGRAVPAAPGGRSRALALLGPPVPGTAVRIVAGGEVLGERQVGTIEVSGPSVTAGYWGEPGWGRWLSTADLGYLADGELVVCGRQGDVVFAAGRNVYPQDAEAAAERVRAVRPGGAVAFALPGDPEPRLALVVETDPPAPAGLAADVRAAVVAELGVTPAVVAAAGARRLPRTSSGKLRRAEARRRYLDGGFEPAP